MAKTKDQARGKGDKPIAPARPSASVVLISPSNEVLLAKRVRTASSFASAHVFPGGNIDPQDGHVPVQGADRHKDSPAYRNAALRELFEESGILLARDAHNNLLRLPDHVAESGRKAIHTKQTTFHAWLQENAKGATLDTENLIPFTHWITPPEIPRRFTTRMYLYLLPAKSAGIGQEKERDIPTPTSDGGVEITSVYFRKPKDWLSRIQARKMFVVPPQYYVLHRLAEDLVGMQGMQTNNDEERRKCALQLAGTGNPPPNNMYIGTMRILDAKHNGHSVLDLSQPGHELDGYDGFHGDSERVMLADRDGPLLRTVGLCWRRDVKLSGSAKL